MAAYGIGTPGDCAVEALLNSERGVDVAIEALRRALARGLVKDICYITDRLKDAGAPAEMPQGRDGASISCSSTETTGLGAARSCAAKPAPSLPSGSGVALDGNTEAALDLVLWKVDGTALARCAGVCRSLSAAARDGHRWRTLVSP